MIKVTVPISLAPETNSLLIGPTYISNSKSLSLSAHSWTSVGLLVQSRTRTSPQPLPTDLLHYTSRSYRTVTIPPFQRITSDTLTHRWAPTTEGWVESGSEPGFRPPTTGLEGGGDGTDDPSTVAGGGCRHGTDPDPTTRRGGSCPTRG